jgi:hypothetical protein
LLNLERNETGFVVAIAMPSWPYLYA